MRQQQTLNLKGKICSLSTPQVMGIMNVTPDSFYSDSRVQGEQAMRERIEQIISEGATMIDIGGCSTRPGSQQPSMLEEKERLIPALRLLRNEYPDLIVSVDTFHSTIARMAVEEYGVSIINDISGGEGDANMFATVAQLGVPYILMHLKGGLEHMHAQHTYTPNVETEVLDYFIERTDRLRKLGVKDIILDPGYGFSKTMSDNFRLFARAHQSLTSLQLPILVGVSRKRMVWKMLDITPEEALNGTTILHTIALLQGGVSILRVHDVRAAVEAVILTREVIQYNY